MKVPVSLLIGVTLLGSPLPLGAQGKPVTVTGIRGVTFGVVLPGVALVIMRTDPANSGQLDIKGPNRGQVQLTFTLPSAMTGPAGAQMPLVFGSSDAGYSQSQAIGGQIGFDPKQPFTASLSNSGRASVFVGGTANPVANQRAGTYTATITLTVTLLP
ncbi:MAG TPA: hypothetical protein VGJ83_06365 [Gemmatimonadales bacterium]|jgi:hypothetical protein